MIRRAATISASSIGDAPLPGSLCPFRRAWASTRRRIHPSEIAPSPPRKGRADARRLLARLRRTGQARAKPGPTLSPRWARGRTMIPPRQRLSVTRLIQSARVSENRGTRPWSVHRITGRTGSGLSWSGPSRSLMGRRNGCATRAEPGCVGAGRGYPSPPPTGPALSAMALGFGPTPRPPPSPLDSRVGAGAPRGAPPREGTLAGCWTSCTPLPA